MKEFEVGKTYKINGPGAITVTKRTRCYITFEGDFSGRREILRLEPNGIFGLGECVIIPSGMKSIEYPCFAGHEAVF